MIPDFLAGVTHAVVTTTSEADAKESGIYAYVELCFGLNGDNSISAIPYIKISKNTFGAQSPKVKIKFRGKEVERPVFTGAVGEKICVMCNNNMEIVKRVVGKYEYEKRYKVMSGRAEEIPLKGKK